VGGCCWFGHVHHGVVCIVQHNVVEVCLQCAGEDWQRLRRKLEVDHPIVPGVCRSYLVVPGGNQSTGGQLLDGHQGLCAEMFALLLR